jgi:ribosome-associated protein
MYPEKGDDSVDGGHDDGREGRGRSAKKRAAQAVEALAIRMIETSDGTCRRLPLTDELRDELRFARSIKARSARKRQIKHLAGLLRQDEEATAAIQAVLDAVGRAGRAEREAFQRIEELRDALCDPDEFAEAIERAVAEFPGLDRQTITRLARSVHHTGDKRAFREIFRRLRTLAEAADDV